MTVRKFLESFLKLKTAKCENIPPEDLPEEKLSIEDEEQLEETIHYIPSFQFIFQPLKILTMSYPGSEINGFKFSAGIPLSQNFMMSHTINMAPKTQQVSTGNPLMDMFAEKTPYYSMGLQYHHGRIINFHQHPFFSLAGQITSNGKVDAMFMKPFGRFKTKLQCSFPNSNVAFSQSVFEIEHASENSKQVMNLGSGFVNYNIVEKLGHKLLFGLDLTYVIPRSQFMNGLVMRYMHSPSQKFYFNFSGSTQTIGLGSWFKVSPTSTIATEMEFGGREGSEACIGYRMKSQKYEVNSALRTTGEIKSTFSYSHSQVYKLKLFLGGNLFKDDFKSGFSFSLGQGEE